jgi:hypothetical protein
MSSTIRLIVGFEEVEGAGGTGGAWDSEGVVDAVASERIREQDARHLLYNKS